MDAVEALTRLGGIADAATIRTLDQPAAGADSSGGRARGPGGEGRLRLPTVEAGRAAARLHGARSHLSAAAHWGWETKWPEAQPERPSPEVATSTRPAGDVCGCTGGARRPTRSATRATTPLRTVLDCARDLPRDEALAAADSALRHGDVTADELAERRRRA